LTASAGFSSAGTGAPWFRGRATPAHLLKSKKDLIRFIEDHASVRQQHGFPAGGRKRIRDWCPGSEFARRGERGRVAAYVDRL
jgi:hypothetical protein